MMRRLAGLAGTSIRTSGCADPSGPWSRWSRGQQGRGRPARRPEDGPCWWQAADWESVLTGMRPSEPWRGTCPENYIRIFFGSEGRRLEADDND